MRRTTHVFVAASMLLLAPIGLRAQDVPESSPQALMHHAQGVAAYVKQEYVEAIKHFTLAYESDPTSYGSLFMAGLMAGNAGQAARADSFYAVLLPNKDKLSPYYRYRLEAQMAGRAGDNAGYIAANRKAAALGPGTKAWYNIAQGAAPSGRASEARESLRQLDPDREPMKGWYSYYSVYTSAAHALGDYEDALSMARRARAAFSGDIRPMASEAEALAAMGRVGDAEKLLADIQAKGPGLGFTPGDAYVTVGQELGAHGNAAAAKNAFENAVKWYDALPADSARSIDSRSGRAYALYNLGRYKELPPIYESLAADAPGTAAWKAWVGVAVALNGDRAKATDVVRRIESKEIVLIPVNSAIFRGMIATALNDRERAMVLFRESGSKALWMHRDPMLLKAHGADWLAFVKAQ